MSMFDRARFAGLSFPSVVSILREKPMAKHRADQDLEYVPALILVQMLTLF